MKTSIVIGLFFTLVIGINACRTQEEPVVVKRYRPVFDQTKKVYIKTPQLSDKLDTTVLIRSNLRDTIAFYWDTLVMVDDFVFESGELIVSLDLINEKPPTFDTFLVARNYRFTADFVDALFPVIPDSIIEELAEVFDTISTDSLLIFNDSHVVLSDSLLPDNTNIDSFILKDEVVEEADDGLKKGKKNRSFSRFIPAFLKSKEQRKVEKRRRQIDENLQLIQARQAEKDSLLLLESRSEFEADSSALTVADTLVLADTVPVKLFFSKAEILADSTRDLFDADTILTDLLKESPWKINDSIPYLTDFSNFFLDSVLLINFDTVYVEIFDSAKIIPQLTFEELSEVQVDTLRFEHLIYLKDEVTFRIYHPNEDDVYIEMVRIAGGDFKIGNNYFDEDERPAYNINVSRFLLSKYEVSNKLFCYFLNDLKCDSIGQIDGHRVIDLYNPETRIRRNKFTRKFDPVDGYDDYPVVNVTWVGAQLFCKNAGGRLPSEAEWEYAAKGGRYAKRFYIDRENKDYDYVNRFSGGNFMNEVGWFVDNSRGQIWVGGRKKPNELGLYDMSGNVWEWCYDKYNNDFYKRNHKSRDPMCLEGQNIRVNRGGSWSSDALYCRITNRNFLSQYSQNPYLGFRYMRQWR